MGHKTNFSFANSAKNNSKQILEDFKILIDDKIPPNDAYISNSISVLENFYKLNSEIIVCPKPKEMKEKTLILGSFYADLLENKIENVKIEYTTVDKSINVFIDKPPTKEFMNEVKNMKLITIGMKICGIRILRNEENLINFTINSKTKFSENLEIQIFSNFKNYEILKKYLKLNLNSKSKKILKSSSVNLSNIIFLSGPNFSGKKFITKTVLKDLKISYINLYNQEDILKSINQKVNVIILNIKDKDQFKFAENDYILELNKTEKILIIISEEKIERAIHFSDLNLEFSLPSKKEIENFILSKLRVLNFRLKYNSRKILANNFARKSIFEINRFFDKFYFENYVTENGAIFEEIKENILISELDDLRIDNKQSEIRAIDITGKMEKYTKQTAKNSEKIYLKQIGGYEKVKDELTKSVIYPLKHKDKIKKFGIKKTNGIILHGPPGCSKTVLAQAIANEAGITFINIPTQNILSCYYGATEKKITNYFEEAKKAAPSILFIDEIDSIGRKRDGSSSTNYMERILNSLLIQISELKNYEVILIASTNRIDILDEALIRSGRFDKHIEVSLPDKCEREKIFEVYLPKTKTLNLKKFAEITDKFSGADIEFVCNNSKYYLFDKNTAVLEDFMVLDSINNLKISRNKTNN